MTCKDCIHSDVCYKKNDYEDFPDRCGDFISVKTLVAVRRPHGEWIVDKNDHGLSFNKCSVCNEEAEWIYGGSQFLSAYCPNCGAKMYKEAK